MSPASQISRYPNPASRHDRLRARRAVATRTSSPTAPRPPARHRRATTHRRDDPPTPCAPARSTAHPADGAAAAPHRDARAVALDLDRAEDLEPQVPSRLVRHRIAILRPGRLQIRQQRRRCRRPATNPLHRQWRTSRTARAATRTGEPRGNHQHTKGRARVAINYRQPTMSPEQSSGPAPTTPTPPGTSESSTSAATTTHRAPRLTARAQPPSPSRLVRPSAAGSLTDDPAPVLHRAGRRRPPAGAHRTGHHSPPAQPASRAVHAATPSRPPPAAHTPPTGGPAHPCRCPIHRTQPGTAGHSTGHRPPTTSRPMNPTGPRHQTMEICRPCPRVVSPNDEAPEPAEPGRYGALLELSGAAR